MLICYWGDPVTIPQANLPAMYIEPIAFENDSRSQYDNLQNNFKVGIVYATKDFYKTTEDVPTVIELKKKLVNMVQGVDPATGKFYD